MNQFTFNSDLDSCFISKTVSYIYFLIQKKTQCLDKFVRQNHGYKGILLILIKLLFEFLFVHLTFLATLYNFLRLDRHALQGKIAGILKP